MSTVTSELQRFVDGFRNEHREARDILLGMIDAFRSRDGARFGELMKRMDEGLGPHMRYEEQTMYGALIPMLGAEYIENMIQDHDRMLGAAGRLMELAGHDPITDDDVAEAESLLRARLPHVSDCDGLAIIIEALPEDQQRAIVESRDRCLAEGVSVMQWAERRGRAPIPPA